MEERIGGGRELKKVGGDRGRVEERGGRCKVGDGEKRRTRRREGVEEGERKRGRE